MPAPHSPNQNHLLAALPAAEFDRILPHLELVPMPLAEALYESGGRLNHVYFPTTCIISLLYVMEDGASAEIAVVGNEGLVYSHGQLIPPLKKALPAKEELPGLLPMRR